MISGNFITARPVGIVDGVDFSAQRPGAQGRRGRHPPHDRHRRDGAAVAVRLLADRRGLQPDDGRSRDQRGHRAAGRQADLPDRDPGHPRKTWATPDSPIDTELPLADAEQLLAALPTRSSPPTPAFYLQHCVKACKAGVERSHILPFAVDGALLLEVYMHDGIGTMVVDEKLESLREATPDDVGGILQLIEPFESDGTLVKRDRTEIERDIAQLHHHRARRRDLRLRRALSLSRRRRPARWRR